MSAPFGRAQGEVGGRQYTLVFNFAAMAAMERQLQMPFPSIMKAMAPNEDGGPKDVMLSLVAGVLWGLLRAKHGNVTYDQAGELMLGGDSEELFNLVNACFEDAFPGESENPPKRAKAGTGTNS